MSEVILEVKNVIKEYGKGEAKVNALDDVSLSVGKNEFLVILGFSGSGKSTLLNMLGAMDKPTSGDILYEGKSIVSMSERGRCEYRRKNIGFIFQSFNLIQDLTALENVEMTASFTGSKKSKDMLEAVGILDKMNNYPKEMSGGQQQRVSIARALVKGGNILLCDEPTGALDSVTGIQTLKLLTEIQKEFHTSIVFVTHTKEIADIADRVIVMRNGKIVEEYKNEHPKNPEDIVW